MLMAIPAELMAERAAAWAESDAAVRAMIVYGSLAQGTADEDSDLDVIIVAEPGQRLTLWDRREQISDLIHGGHDALWHQEPLWQRAYRYQSWDQKLNELDLTAFDGGTWLWLNYLRGKLRHGEVWMVRYGVMDTLNNRVLPLLGTAGHAAHHGLDAADIDRVHRAAPSSAEPAELRRSLRATAELYAWALDRWSRRTGQPAPRNPLTSAITDKLHVEDQ
jgi:predicted nucleotidyltransferase